MAKPKANLNGVLDGMAAEPAPVPAAPEPPATPTRSGGRPRRNEPTRLVGAQLGLRYSKSLNLLSAETGKSNRQLMEEALDMLFVAYAAKQVA